MAETNIQSEQTWEIGPGGNEYLVGPRLCGRCKQMKIASVTGPSDFARQTARASAGCFSSVCKTCRKADTKTPEFKSRRRELYRERQAAIMLEVSNEEQTTSGLTIHKTRLNYSKASGAGILKDRMFANDNEGMAAYYGVNQHTLMNWQREGCPKRMTAAAWKINREMLQLREEMIREGNTEDANMYLRILRQENWQLGHLQ